MQQNVKDRTAILRLYRILRQVRTPLQAITEVSAAYARECAQAVATGDQRYALDSAGVFQLAGTYHDLIALRTREPGQRGHYWRTGTLALGRQWWTAHMYSATGPVLAIECPTLACAIKKAMSRLGHDGIVRADIYDRHGRAVVGGLTEGTPLVDVWADIPAWAQA